jgi:hypothetical protein
MRAVIGTQRERDAQPATWIGAARHTCPLACMGVQIPHATMLTLARRNPEHEHAGLVLGRGAM